MPLQSIESTLYCYVFKGPSYAALQRLEKFIRDVEGKKSVLEIVSDLSMNKSIPKENPFEELISEVFILA